MQTKIMKLADINPAPYNPRKLLKPGDAEYEALTKSLDRFGLVEPLIVNAATGTLIGGHQRLNVLKEKGETEAEVVIVETTEENEKLLNIALNKIEGDWDYTKLSDLFKEFTDDDIAFTGFSQEELTNLFGDAAGGENYSYEDDSDDTSEKPESKDAEKKPKPEPEFNIFLSFPSRELAEQWLKQEGVEAEFAETSRNITIRMEGADYGTRC